MKGFVPPDEEVVDELPGDIMATLLTTSCCWCCWAAFTGGLAKEEVTSLDWTRLTSPPEDGPDPGVGPPVVEPA